jgi:lipid A 3-O-deacylase
MLRPLMLVMTLLSCQFLFSQTQHYENESGLRSDNDVYLLYGLDKYYTNGLFLNYRHLLRHHTAASSEKKILELEAGQKMYNAHSGNITEVSDVDRPFAAYLFAGGKLDWFFSDEQVIQAGLQLGVIGPQALGEELQKLIHHTFQFYRINGWEFQVTNEFEVNASLQYLKLLTRSASSKTDLSFSGYVHAGTTFSGAGAGVVLRTGRINALTESSFTNSRLSLPDKKLPGELFFYVQPMLNWVAYDGTIEGGLFRSFKGPTTFDVYPIVVSVQPGIQYAARRWTLDFSIVFDSREVKSTAKAHQYGSLGAFYRF